MSEGGECRPLADQVAPTGALGDRGRGRVASTVGMVDRVERPDEHCPDRHHKRQNRDLLMAACHRQGRPVEV